MNQTRRRILFIGEAGTLSHVVRPYVLARGLDPEKYEVLLACDPRFNHLFEPLPFQHVPIESRFAPDRVLQVLSSVNPLYDLGILDEYIQTDLRLLREYQPDLVVGDMRQSLAISSRLAHVPYVNIINAQWSPFARLDLELPEYPMAGVVGAPLAEVFFKLFFPAGSALHALPFNLIKLKYGIPEILLDIKQVYSTGDYVVYPDVPEIVPAVGLPDNHRYLGPILWSPKVALPDWWERLPEDRKLIYLGLGSSGQHKVVQAIVEATADLPVTVMVATAGRSAVDAWPANFHTAQFLPGLEAAARADLVICTGGSMPAQQSLAGGTPILAIASNADQMVYARAVRRAGAGEVLAEHEADAHSLARLVTRLLENHSYHAAANRLAQVFKQYDAAQRFAQLVEQIFGETGEQGREQS
jgi:UDP:flavonoid glycosyltransferase YjiC (YdhE family)